ncbi:MAG: tetratricopeptide repeat protein [Planctomycetota bacterium]
MRKIRSTQQRQLVEETQQDDLAEGIGYVDRLVELNAEEAERQIAYHLNRWLEIRGGLDDGASLPDLFKPLNAIVDQGELERRFSQTQFDRTDILHLRNAFLFSRMVEHIDSPESMHDDPLLSDWLKSVRQQQGDKVADQLTTATRLADWLFRNIAWVPMQIGATAKPSEVPDGMVHEGPGYRQTVFQTAMRGRGDWMQRSRLFVELCYQANLDGLLVGINLNPAEVADPWAAGVAIGGEVYLFDFETGIFVPGPGGVGIATLSQARRDASVMRRMKVPGFFDYPIDKETLSSCIAILPVKPEAASPRLKLLNDSLTGKLRFRTHIDLPALVQRVDNAGGISGVRLWEVPLQAEVYQAAMEKSADRDANFAVFYRGKWAMLEEKFPSSERLKTARWRQLKGEFAENEEDGSQGARTLLLLSRSPEFEIDDLRTNVDLQNDYGVRRQANTTPEEYDRQIRAVQSLFRMTKRTATYWISLMQYDDGRFDDASNWFSQRVLLDDQQNVWGNSAKYNLARTYERLGKIDKAIEIYKTQGISNEHGHRIRARLLGKQDDES